MPGEALDRLACSNPRPQDRGRLKWLDIPRHSRVVHTSPSRLLSSSLGVSMAVRPCAVRVLASSLDARGRSPISTCSGAHRERVRRTR